MFKNYLIASLRHLRKRKLNFLFKLTGVSLALFSFLFVSTYISYQLSFDRFHVDAHLIYRVTSLRKDGGITDKYAFAPMAIGAALKQLPEIESIVRIGNAGHTYLRRDQEVWPFETLVESDSTLFDVLTFRFIKGDRRALANPRSIVLTKTWAEVVFGTTDVLDRTILLNAETQPYQISAVIEDPPANFHLSIGGLINHRWLSEESLSLKSISDPTVFIDHSRELYVKLREPMSIHFKDKVDRVLDGFIPKSSREEFGFSIDFQPVTAIHLDSRYRFDSAIKGNPVYLYIYSTLGILLLIIAIINYVNLSIADFNSRSKETGVRRILGAANKHLLAQAVAEAMVFGFLSLGIALGLAYLVFPQVKQVLDPQLQFNMVSDPLALTLFGICFVFFLFFASWLPARQLNINQLTHVLKAPSRGYNSKLSIGLMFVQFAVSALCLCCTIVAGQQVDYIFHKPLGFERDNLVVLSMPEEFTVERLKTFKTELKRIPEVTAVSNSSFRIGSIIWKDWYFVEEAGSFKQVELYEVFSDDELFKTLEIPVLRGRTFRADMPSDSGAAFVINETAAHELGYDDPIGKRIYTHPEDKGKWDGTIVGVVADLNIGSLTVKVRPLVMRLPWQNENPDRFIYVRYTGDDQQISRTIEATYRNVMPGYPLMLRYVDELFASRHQNEIRAHKSLQSFTIIILVLSMLGVFSMATFIATRRMKEFGIRKVMGASTVQIAGLHINYFVRIAMVANAVALPVAYWALQDWLAAFAYRIQISPTPFVMVGLISILIVVISGGYSAAQSGRLNPVEVLKME